MKKRMVLMLAVVLVFVAAIGGVKFFQIRGAMAQQGSFQPPPETVTTVVAQPQPWEASMNAVGSVVAVNGVTVSADLPGLVEQIAFQSGQPVNHGDVLLRLDTKQERAQLAAAEAQRELSRVALRRAQELLPNGIIPQSTSDQASAEFKQADARVNEIQASIDRKTIRAPFAGTLGIRQVNLGQYLAGGAPIVSLQALQPVFVDFSVPQQQVGLLTAGAAVHLKSDTAAGASEVGKIAAVDAVIDESTRNARVRAIFDNRALKLRPGMFVEAQLAGGAQSTAITLPASAISYAPFGDSVFIVEEMKGPGGKSYRGVRQQFVKLGGSRGDQVAVISGVKAGEEIVSSGAFKLRPGTAVQVNNSVQPANNAVVKTEDS
jgi:membrane fusion protein (multidrug efflux system)